MTMYGSPGHSCKFLSGNESVQAFFCLFVLLLEIQLSEEVVGISLTGLIPHFLFVCLYCCWKSNYQMRIVGIPLTGLIPHKYKGLSCFEQEVVDNVDIGGIVYHHCLNFLFLKKFVEVSYSHCLKIDFYGVDQIKYENFIGDQVTFRFNQVSSI